MNDRSQAMQEWLASHNAQRMLNGDIDEESQEINDPKDKLNFVDYGYIADQIKARIIHGRNVNNDYSRLSNYLPALFDTICASLETWGSTALANPANILYFRYKLESMEKDLNASKYTLDHPQILQAVAIYKRIAALKDKLKLTKPKSTEGK